MKADATIAPPAVNGVSLPPAKPRRKVTTRKTANRNPGESDQDSGEREQVGSARAALAANASAKGSSDQSRVNSAGDAATIVSAVETTTATNGDVHAAANGATTRGSVRRRRTRRSTTGEGEQALSGVLTSDANAADAEPLVSAEMSERYAEFLRRFQHDHCLTAPAHLETRLRPHDALARRVECVRRGLQSRIELAGLQLARAARGN